jgi:hypothetical protein
MVIRPCVAIFCGIASVGSHHIDEESEEESAAYTQHQPSDAQASELIAAVVEADAFEIDVRDLCEFVDEHQSLTLVNEQLNDFVDAAENDGANQGSCNPIHTCNV